MKLALTSAVALAAALVAVAPASAATYVLNGGAAINPPASFSPTQCFQNSVAQSCELTDNVAAGNTYTSLYEFTLGTALTMTGSIFTNSLNGISFLTVNLYNNGVGGAFGANGTPASTYVLSDGQARLPDQMLARGNYTVSVNARVNNTATTVASTFAFASPTPEPASWGLMVLGFGAVGGALRTSRRKIAFA